MTPDLLVHKETQDHKDPQDQLVRQGQPDQLVRQGQPDLPEQPERLEHLASLPATTSR